jgi:hypothetical protein
LPAAILRKNAIFCLLSFRPGSKMTRACRGTASWCVEN